MQATCTTKKEEVCRGQWEGQTDKAQQRTRLRLKVPEPLKDKEAGIDAEAVRLILPVADGGERVKVRVLQRKEA